MQPYVADTLRILLFHKDFRKHMEGAATLLDTASHDPPAALSCLDLLLRWIVLRQADTNTNTQCLLKLLELAKVLLLLLQEQEMELTELELLVLVPCLIEKSGHNQDRIRAMYRDLIQVACQVASVQRVLEMLLVCAQYSKNNRRYAVGGVGGGFVGVVGLLMGWWGCCFHSISCVAICITHFLYMPSSLSLTHTHIRNILPPTPTSPTHNQSCGSMRRSRQHPRNTRPLHRKRAQAQTPPHMRTTGL